MKKFFIVLALAVLGLSAAAQESMSYISYYPTPFASYTTITANEVTVSNPATGGGLITATLGTVKIGEANVGKDLNTVYLYTATNQNYQTPINTAQIIVGSGNTGTLNAKNTQLSAILRLNQTLGSANSVTTGGELHLIDGLMMSESGSTNKQLFPSPAPAANKSLAKISPGMIWKQIKYYPDPNNIAVTKTAKFLVINDEGSQPACVNVAAPSWPGITSASVTPNSTTTSCSCTSGQTADSGTTRYCCPGGAFFQPGVCNRCSSVTYWKNDGSTGGCCENSTDVWNGSDCSVPCNGWHPASAPSVCCPTTTNYYSAGCKTCLTDNPPNNSDRTLATGCKCLTSPIAGYDPMYGYQAGARSVWNAGTGACECKSSEVAVPGASTSQCCPAGFPMLVGYCYKDTCTRTSNPVYKPGTDSYSAGTVEGNPYCTCNDGEVRFLYALDGYTIYCCPSTHPNRVGTHGDCTR